VVHEHEDVGGTMEVLMNKNECTRGMKFYENQKKKRMRKRIGRGTR
jgi:hypothetical protein